MRQAPRTHANSSMTVNRASDGQYRPDGTGRDEWIREPAMYVRESASARGRRLTFAVTKEDIQRQRSHMTSLHNQKPEHTTVDIPQAQPPHKWGSSLRFGNARSRILNQQARQKPSECAQSRHLLAQLTERQHVVKKGRRAPDGSNTARLPSMYPPEYSIPAAGSQDSLARLDNLVTSLVTPVLSTPRDPMLPDTTTGGLIIGADNIAPPEWEIKHNIPPPKVWPTPPSKDAFDVAKDLDIISKPVKRFGRKALPFNEKPLKKKDGVVDWRDSTLPPWLTPDKIAAGTQADHSEAA